MAMVKRYMQKHKSNLYAIVLTFRLEPVIFLAAAICLCVATLEKT